ncbi:hypothetical protein [Halalkalicoccus subterraneus]|uniref:hypothetical protein n=1 Tax=Halalkalicoccus subterraneus TaxID=2675002 RepID=UPI000EFC9B2A|nr:hypothetical protein [Halalkalicoccus subterraneus]
MSENSAGRESDTEREWRATVERYVSANDDCTRLSAGLAESRRAFDDRGTNRSSRLRLVVSGLVVLAIPLIVYSELITPTGAINYGGVGIGLTLMVAGGLSCL